MGTREPVILVVDDDENLRFALDALLTSRGFAVRQAGDGDAALRALDAERPDAVLLDWRMPGEGGLTVCERMLVVAPDLRIVMLTGLADLRDRRAALDAGARGFLVKGVDGDAIEAELRRVLDQPAGNGHAGRAGDGPPPDGGSASAYPASSA
jgi:DNA-binding response OmpR family regulator